MIEHRMIAWDAVEKPSNGYVSSSNGYAQDSTTPSKTV
jgi:hypothetical protein